MKKLLVISLFLVSANAFALSCPSNGAIIDKDDSLQEVLQRCGAPANRSDYIRTAGEVWEYNEAQSNLKMAIQFVQDRVVNIHLTNDISTCVTPNDQPSTTKTLSYCQPNSINVASTSVCKTPIGVGNTSQDVEDACGTPNNKSQVRTTNITELKYTGSEVLNNLIFENGKLEDWN